MEYALARRSKGSGSPPVRPICPAWTGTSRRLHGSCVDTGRPGQLMACGLAAAAGGSGQARDRRAERSLRAGGRARRRAGDAHAGSSIGARSAPLGVQRLCAECEEEVQRQPIEEEDEELRMKRRPGRDDQRSGRACGRRSAGYGAAASPSRRRCAASSSPASATTSARFTFTTGARRARRRGHLAPAPTPWARTWCSGKANTDPRAIGAGA